MRVYLNVDTIVLICYHQRITRAALSRDAKITPEYLGQILHRGYCGAKTAKKIADALGLQTDQAVLPRTLQIPDSYKPQFAPKRYRLRVDSVPLYKEAIYGIMRMGGMTFDSLGAALGCSRQYVHQKVSDGRCSKLFAHRLADAMRVSYETITKEENKNEAI